MNLILKNVIKMIVIIKNIDNKIYCVKNLMIELILKGIINV